MDPADCPGIWRAPSQLGMFDLGEKVLYKNKEMTVEFHDAKLSDLK